MTPSETIAKAEAQGWIFCRIHKTWHNHGAVFNSPEECLEYDHYWARFRQFRARRQCVFMWGPDVAAALGASL